MKCNHSSDDPVYYSDQSYFPGFSRYTDQVDQKITTICLSKVANSDVYLKKIVDDYPNFPISKCFHEFQSTRYTNSRQIPSVSNGALLWADKYTPQSCSSFLSACPGIRKLVQWLERWKSKNSKSENSPNFSLNGTRTINSMKKRLRPSPRYHSDDEFAMERPAHKRCKYNSSILEPVGNSCTNRNLFLPIGYSHNQIDISGPSSSEEVGSSGSDEENYEYPVMKRLANWRFKAFLLVGPHGTGKSSLIYALAKDLGFKVFELNSSSRRSGKDITSQFQIALDSHHVAKDNLSTSFSTFQMITSLSNTKAISKPLHKSAANFFKPVPKMDTSCMKDASSAKDSGSLNLNCNSIVLFDEVDVLFESDRGFWSGLSSMIQLARRPVILTASDPSIVHNLPVPAYVCHVTSASLELVVPYIRVLCLAEGFDLDIQSANSLIKSIQPPKLTFNEPSPKYFDLRRLINELQWLCISAPDEDRDDHIKYNPFVSGNLIDDPLILVEKMCPSLCNLSGRANYKPSVNPKCVIGNDLDDLFSTEIENDSNKIAGKTTTQTDKIIDTRCQRSVEYSNQYSPLIDLSLDALKQMSDNLSFWDICQSGVARASLWSVIDSVSQIIDITSDSSSNSNSSSFNTNSSVNRTSNCSIQLGSTKSVINFHIHHWGPVIPFDIINDEFLNVFWIHLVLNQIRTTLEGAEIEFSTTTNLSCPGNSVKTDAHLRSDLSQGLSLAKCVHDLNRCGIGVGCHNHSKRLACDYLPALRVLACGEKFRQEVSTKRRFLHYFDRISLFLRPSTREFLAKSHLV
ncbi:hypothetical protein MN116_005155 [Schistosoma mekongi]|uniref:ATPase AAA-type core domain-containing protein n=1 Tax=Schistosoma mekongi TaxID=38744 RepID=A0AAE1ZCH9_SCHME|nr:hypothetical protein MN116_005155 [Schistosoma mekongi]